MLSNKRLVEAEGTTLPCPSVWQPPTKKPRKVYDRSTEPKACGDCKKILAASCYTTDKHCRDGLAKYCRPCKKIREQPAKLRSYAKDAHGGCRITIDDPTVKPGEPTKLCSACKEIRPLRLFAKGSACNDGYQHRCRLCNNGSAVRMQHSIHACTSCDAEFASPESLAKHQANVHQPQTPCETCGLVFDCLGWKLMHLHYEHQAPPMGRTKSLRVLFCKEHALQKSRLVGRKLYEFDQQSTSEQSLRRNAVRKAGVIRYRQSEKGKVYFRNWQLKHKEKVVATRAKFNAKPSTKLYYQLYAKSRSGLPHVVMSRRRANIRATARRRGLECTLSDDEMGMLCMTSCTYCGRQPTPLSINGIDRVNSSLGYVSGNCVASCFPCNWMKCDDTTQDFIAHVKVLKSTFLQGYQAPDDTHMTSRSYGDLMSKYAYRARERKHIPFELSREEFRGIVLKKFCAYCGSVSSPEKVHGVDRVDNAQGYCLDNCVAACFPCNRMKSHFSIDEFRNHLRAIISHMRI